MLFFKKGIPTAHDAGHVCWQASPEARTSIDPEGIAFFHLTSGVIFRANRVGARIWQGVLDRQATADIAAEISREYGAPLEHVERDTTAFLNDLKAHRFLLPVRGN